MAYEVFISYSSKDKDVANAICANLEANRIRCWIAPRDIIPGVEWGEGIIQGIEQCKIMVLIFSSNSNQSPQVKREVERAINKGLVIIPFRIEEITPTGSLEYFLSSQHWLDAITPPLEKHIEKLIKTLHSLLETTSENEEKNNFEAKTNVTRSEKKEFWQRLPKFVKHYLAVNEIIEVKDPKIYGEFSESTIRDLAMKGQIQIEDPREFQLFFYNKYGEMLKFSRLPRRLHFIKKMQYEAEKERDPKIKRLRLSLVCALYEELNQVTEDEGRSRENQLKVNELMDESHKYYNDYVDRISSENYKQQKIEENENIKSNLKLLIQSKKVDFDDKIIQIPGTSARWLLEGYLWYESGCSLDSRHFVGKRGDWVEFGDIVFKEYGIEFYNPVSGFLLPQRFTNWDSLWEIIPPKNYDLPEDIGEFIFGDLIDVMYKKFKNGTMYDKYPIEHLEKTVEELKNCQIIEKEIDGELKSIFDSI